MQRTRLWYTDTRLPRYAVLVRVPCYRYVIQYCGANFRTEKLPGHRKFLPSQLKDWVWYWCPASSCARGCEYSKNALHSTLMLTSWKRECYCSKVEMTECKVATDVVGLRVKRLLRLPTAYSTWSITYNFIVYLLTSIKATMWESTSRTWKPRSVVYGLVVQRAHWQPHCSSKLQMFN